MQKWPNRTDKLDYIIYKLNINILLDVNELESLTLQFSQAQQLNFSLTITTLGPSPSKSTTLVYIYPTSHKIFKLFLIESLCYCDNNSCTV